ncbi:Thermophilic serine proteinase [subsurface metagenome]
MKKWLGCTFVTVAIVCLFMSGSIVADVVSVAEDSEQSNYAVSAQAEVPSTSDTYLDRQWALDRLHSPHVWGVTLGSPDILVAVLDTGIDRNHEDLAGKVVAEVNFSDSPVVDDLHGHGTHIAGIIAANTDNSIGIAGVAPGCLLMNVKVADDNGRCDAAAIAEGIVWAVDRGARVLNISLCVSEPSKELEEAIIYAWSCGAVIVVAAGNDSGSVSQYPAYYPECIAVTATREDDSRSPLANYGDWVDVAAPGYQIYSTLPDDQYGYKTGTSQAAAYVTGLAVLLYSIAIDGDSDGWVNDEVRAAIESSCQQIDGSGMGNGLVDSGKAVAQLDMSTFQ